MLTWREEEPARKNHLTFRMSGSWDSTQSLVAATSSHMTRPATSDTSDSHQSPLLRFSLLDTGAAPLQMAQCILEENIADVSQERLQRQLHPTMLTHRSSW